MCWSSPMWGGWGPPWEMFLWPMFFILLIVCAFFVFKGVFPFCSYQTNHSSTNNNEMLKELQKLRQEVEKLRLDSQK